MVSSPVQNLSDFLKHKPPLVVVLLCFVALAVSSFYFAFEIEKDGPTVDSDKQYVSNVENTEYYQYMLAAQPTIWSL